jgi:hypothetical protein
MAKKDRFTMLIAEILEIQVYSPSGRIKHTWLEHLVVAGMVV